MNRNKIIDLFVANLSNAILHKILEKAISQSEIAQKYNKEIKNSWQIALIYREKINPKDLPLPPGDIGEITQKVTRKVKVELNLRISKGYKNLDISSVELLTEEALKEMNIL